MQPNHSIEVKPPVICAGLFFVITGNTAADYLIPEESVRRYYDGLTIADNCRDKDAARAQVIRQTFGVKDATIALPAPDHEALLFCWDHYDGPAQEAVRVLAARYLLGNPFHRGPPLEGGRDRIAPKPTLPNGPQGTESPEPPVEKVHNSNQPLIEAPREQLYADSYPLGACVDIGGITHQVCDVNGVAEFVMV